MKIKEIKKYIPNKQLTNDDLSRFLDTSDEWITKRTGIKTRYWTEQTIEEMTKKCVKQLKGENYDAILVTSMSTLNTAPSLSSKCAEYLKQQDCLCLDLNGACTGFVYAMQVANGLFATGFNNILIVSAEKMSSIIDKEDRSTAILFGDGVCAVSLVNSSSKFIKVANKIEHRNDALTKLEDQHLHMNGQAVFKFATKTVCECLDKYEYLNEIDYFVFHQANIRIINNIKKKYKIANEKVITNLEKYANTSSVSIPLALQEIDLQIGDKVMMVGFGAGLCTSAIVYEH